MGNMSKNSQLWRTSFYGVKRIDYDSAAGQLQKQRPGYSPTSEKKTGTKYIKLQVSRRRLSGNEGDSDPYEMRTLHLP